MSISDLIVVMKDGVVHQIGAPQAVYDDPVNLFVATFLGTPPINVFRGAVRGGKLYIGNEAVLDVKGVADQEVTVGIRPEGFEPEKDGPMTCGLNRVEVMGRDISVVCSHDACESENLRIIIDSENLADMVGVSVGFRLKAAKVHLFNRETGARIPFDKV